MSEATSRAEMLASEARIPRLRDIRDEDVREDMAVQDQILPMPDPREGIAFRWVAVRLMSGHDLNSNYAAAQRQGWTPVLLEDVPEMKLSLDRNSKYVNDGYVEVGGQVLCAMSKRKHDLLKKREDDANAQVMRSVIKETRTTNFTNNPFSARTR